MLVGRIWLLFHRTFYPLTNAIDCVQRQFHKLSKLTKDAAVRNRHLWLAQRVCELLICVSGIILSPSRGAVSIPCKDPYIILYFVSNIFERINDVNFRKKSIQKMYKHIECWIKISPKASLIYNECRVLSSDAILNDHIIHMCGYVLSKHTNSCIYSTTFKVNRENCHIYIFK